MWSWPLSAQASRRWSTGAKAPTYYQTDSRSRMIGD
jgi:hypothetical protein